MLQKLELRAPWGYRAKLRRLKLSEEQYEHC
jgi:hypothetical protein